MDDPLHRFQLMYTQVRNSALFGIINTVPLKGFLRNAFFSKTKMRAKQGISVTRIFCL